MMMEIVIAIGQKSAGNNYMRILQSIATYHQRPSNTVRANISQDHDHFKLWSPGEAPWLT